MLVLSRKIGQGVLLGKNIEITILRVEGDQVRIGIKAPKEVSIVRRELLEEIRSETEAAQSSRDSVREDRDALKRISRVLGKPPKKT